jgi:hypothetical protein
MASYPVLISFTSGFDIPYAQKLDFRLCRQPTLAVFVKSGLEILPRGENIFQTKFHIHTYSFA